MKTVYVTIGNSDNKLSQQEWSAFCEETDKLLRKWASDVHAECYSLPPAPYQNAIWSFEIITSATMACCNEMAHLAGVYGQDGFAWAETDEATVIPSNSAAGRRLEELLSGDTVKRDRPTRHTWAPGPCM